MPTFDKNTDALIGSPTPAPDVRLPNLIVIGAMKSSTTTFYELLGQHPGVWFSDDKEPHYFTSDEYGSEQAWQSYLQLFAGADDSQSVLAEASTGYSKIPHLGPTPQRIKADLGNPKLLYLIRDPVARTISNYRHSYAVGGYPTGTTLSQAIERDPIIIQASRYAFQIEAYREVFGPDAMRVITADELHRDPVGVMRHAEAYLELEPYVGWPDKLNSANAAADLARTARLQRWGMSDLALALGKILPKGVRQRLKAMVPAVQPPPDIAAGDRCRVLELIADDLRSLREILGTRISNWPSVVSLESGGFGH